MKATSLTILLILLLLPLLSGCGATTSPLPDDDRKGVLDWLTEIDSLQGSAAIAEYEAPLTARIHEIADRKGPEYRVEAAQLNLRRAYCAERLGRLDNALDLYKAVAGSKYDTVALMRIADISEHLAALPEHDTKAYRKKAADALERAANVRLDVDAGGTLGPLVPIRTPAVGDAEPVQWSEDFVRRVATKRQDAYNQGKALYRMFEFVVRLCGGEERNSSFILAIVVIAVLAKLITSPLSAAQFRSMQQMQAVQPELKKLQEKYKDDKQKIAKEQMELFRKHGVNPAGSCLPMLIQMPILIGVYYGIRSFVFRFWDVSFLYIQNLANPDVIELAGRLWPGPLLLLYGVSMYFSQKLIATPAATPEQQQQQKLMAIMMPVILVMVLQSLSAAFILYWFLQNILMTGHQYFITRPQRLAAAAGAGPQPAPPETPPPAAGPPPEAIQKLSKGTRRRKKKKRR